MDYKSVSFKADDVEGRIFRGYASTWDKDQGEDIIEFGAFRKTLSERGTRVKVMYNHSELIGKPLSILEESKGLFVEAKISNIRRGDEVLELMKDGALDSMSITYSIPQGKAMFDKERGARVIKELKLYEFGPVDYPMNEAAIITGVKTIRDAVKMGKDLDDESKKELSEMIAELKALLSAEPPASTQQPEQPPELTALLEGIKNFGAIARI